MKTILVFDDDILNAFSNIGLKRELETYKSEPKTDFGIAFQYGMKVLDCTRKEKRFIRYMFSKSKRIQKKWDKRYNYKFREVSYNPLIGSMITASV